MKKPYNGHESWNAWNVALWIGNDEPTYRWAMECLNRHQRIGASVTAFLGGCDKKTPDGAKYSRRSVTLALKGLSE
jgi:hypothetical protein